MIRKLEKLGDRLLGRFVPKVTASASADDVTCTGCGPCTVECPGGTYCCSDGSVWCVQ